LSVSEIAYQLGFEYPHSFSKLFKAKAKLSPLEIQGVISSMRLGSLFCCLILKVWYY